MKLFCPTCDMTRLDSQIQELTETLAQINARSNRLLASMREIGMSIPAISSATGASVGTVHGTLSKLKASDTSAPIVGTDGLAVAGDVPA